MKISFCPIPAKIGQSGHYAFSLETYSNNIGTEISHFENSHSTFKKGDFDAQNRENREKSRAPIIENQLVTS